MSADKKEQIFDEVTGVADTGHDYDGIRELDNNLPNWWLFVLFASIVFGFGYWIYYESFESTPKQADEYQAALRKTKKMNEAFIASRGAATDDVLIAFSKEADKVAEGKASYAQFCASCHAAEGQGLIGPNLTDSFWIHGSAPTEIHNIVANGVPSKGMPAWESVLGVAGTENVVAFLLTIQNTDKPGKAPEGEQVAAQ